MPVCPTAADIPCAPADINPTQFGKNQSVVTLANNFRGLSIATHFIDVSVDARLAAAAGLAAAWIPGGRCATALSPWIVHSSSSTVISSRRSGERSSS
jgi:hypothetical protein